METTSTTTTAEELFEASREAMGVALDTLETIVQGTKSDLVLSHAGTILSNLQKVEDRIVYLEDKNTGEAIYSDWRVYKRATKTAFSANDVLVFSDVSAKIVNVEEHFERLKTYYGEAS